VTLLAIFQASRWPRDGKLILRVFTRFGPLPTQRRQIEVAPILLGGTSFRGLRLLGLVGLGFDLQDDRSLNQPIKESHRERPNDACLLLRCGGPRRRVSARSFSTWTAGHCDRLV
jgi:hypothetical protein